MTTPLIDRFEAKVRVGRSGCHLWMANQNNKGYGMIRVPGAKNKRLAHRTAYELYIGPIPEGFHVLHRCDTPPCVNPDHLFLGTHKDNMRDKERKDRANHGVNVLKGSAHGASKLTEDKVRQVRTMFADGMLCRDIATHFGVAKSTIQGVTGGFSWRHVK